MSFKENYPTLFTLFAGYFSANYDNLSDEYIVNEFIKDINNEELYMANTEISNLINDIKYWESAAYEANRYFSSEKEMKLWLNKINYLLK